MPYARGRTVASHGQLFGPALVDSAFAPPVTDAALVDDVCWEIAVSLEPYVVPDPVDDPDGDGEVDPGVNPAPGASICGAAVPLTWCEIVPPDGVTRRYAKTPINVGDPKAPRALTFGTVRRSLSNAFADNRGSLMSPLLIDTDGALRALEDADSLVGSRYTQYVASQAQLRADPTAKTRVFDGTITDAEPLAQRTFALTVTDVLTLLLDEFHTRTFPQRVFTLADFPTMGNAADDPDYPGNPTMLGTPVPVLYGRLSDEWEAEPTGVVPWIFTGRVPFASRGGQLWDEYICAGHALGAWQSHFVASGGGLSTGTEYPSRVQINAGSGLVEVAWPGTTWWADEFGATPYIERNGHRYAAMYMFGPRSDLSREGKVPHVSNVWGIEDVGDGSGAVITDLYRQILHLLVNWIFQSYETGAWLGVPTVGAGLELYARIDTTTIEAIKTLRDAQLAGGIEGAWILGHGGQAVTLRELLTTAGTNGHFDFGPNRHGQLIFSAYDATAAINRTLTAFADTIARTYKAKRRRDLVRNVVTYRYARRYVPELVGFTPAEGELLPVVNTEVNPEWASGDLEVRNAASVTKYGERPEDIDFEMIRVGATADFIAELTLDENASGQVQVAFDEGPCGIDTDLGQTDSLEHFDALSATARRIRCEAHELNLDAWTVKRINREIPS